MLHCGLGHPDERGHIRVGHRAECCDEQEKLHRLVHLHKHIQGTLYELLARAEAQASLRSMIRAGTPVCVPTKM